MTYHIAINRNHQGKLPKDATPGQWAAFNDGFTNCNLDIAGIAAAIQAGYAVAPCMVNNRRRKAENFEQAQHVGIDLDNGELTLAEVMSLSIVGRHAALVHTTASHTPAHPRLRVIFLLDRPIADPEKYTLLIRALLHEFGTADAACNDPARLFFGAVNCEMLIPGNILTLEAAADYVAAYRAMDAVANPPAPPSGRPSRVIVPAAGGMYTRHLDSLLERVVMAPNGEKWHTLRDISRTLGGYVAGGYIGASEAENLLRAAIESRRGEVANMTHAYRTIEMGIAYGQRDPLFYEAAGPVDVPEDDPLLALFSEARTGRIAELEAVITAWDAVEGDPDQLAAVLSEYDSLMSWEPGSTVSEMAAKRRNSPGAGRGG